MPAGSLRTMVLPQSIPHTIGRDFQTLLLDSLRTVDETVVHGLDDELGDLDDAAAERGSELSRLVERLRRLDGYVASLIIDGRRGGLGGGDTAPGVRLPT